VFVWLRARPPPKEAAMKPPRRWAVWMVVVVLSAGVGFRVRTALAESRGGPVLPAELQREQSGEPEPGPVPIWIRMHLELTRLLQAARVANDAVLAELLLRSDATENRAPIDGQRWGRRK
jgi:hypothetical protein